MIAVAFVLVVITGVLGLLCERLLRIARAIEAQTEEVKTTNWILGRAADWLEGPRDMPGSGQSERSPELNRGVP